MAGRLLRCSPGRVLEEPREAARAILRDHGPGPQGSQVQAGGLDSMGIEGKLG